MTRRVKEFERIKNNPKNVRFEKLEQLLLSKGFEESRPRRGSSHCTFSKDSAIITIPYSKPVKEKYVRCVIEMIETSEDNCNGKES